MPNAVSVCASLRPKARRSFPYNAKARGGIAIVVYVDVLLVVNFMVNYLLLRLVAVFSGKAADARRCCFGALLGALGALLMFFPRLPPLFLPALRLLLAAAMTGAAFGGGKLFLRRVFLLYAASFLFSGLMTAVSLLLQPTGMLVYRGVVSFDIGLPALLGAVASGYAVSWLLSLCLRARSPTDSICRLTVVTERGSCTVPALIDTGCALTEPFSSLPVAIVEQAALKGIADLPADSEKIPAGWRLVRYRTIGDGGMLRAFRPRELVIETRGGAVRTREAYVALLPASCGGGVKAILNPALLGSDLDERVSL